MQYLIIAFLLFLSGIFSGLTIGVTGLSKTEVLRASDLGDNYATRVLKVIGDANLLLVSLLIGNTAVNSTLAIFLGTAVGEGVAAGFVSTFLIVIFGEIIPASIVSRHPLRIGAALTPFVKFVMFILYPIAKPIAIVLDKYVGTEGIVILSRRELVHIFNQLNKSFDSDIDDLDKNALMGTILLSEKNVGEHMSNKIFSLKSSIIIDKQVLKNIKESGRTRIPIISSNNEVVGILNSKDLIGINYNKNVSVSSLMKKDNIYFVNSHDKLDDVMHYMMKQHLHIAIVKAYNTIVGVITLEDILEELLLTEIIDEFDQNEIEEEKSKTFQTKNNLKKKIFFNKLRRKKD